MFSYPAAKNFFLQKPLSVHVFNSTFLIKLVFYPSSPWTKEEKYLQSFFKS